MIKNANFFVFWTIVLNASFGFGGFDRFKNNATPIWEVNITHPSLNMWAEKLSEVICEEERGGWHAAHVMLNWELLNGCIRL